MSDDKEFRNGDRKEDSGNTERPGTDDSKSTKGSEAGADSGTDESRSQDTETFMSQEDIEAIARDDAYASDVTDISTSRFNRASADYDPEEQNVQLAEHWTYRDKEYDEHGYF